MAKIGGSCHALALRRFASRGARSLERFRDAVLGCGLILGAVLGVRLTLLTWFWNGYGFFPLDSFGP